MEEGFSRLEQSGEMNDNEAVRVRACIICVDSKKVGLSVHRVDGRAIDGIGMNHLFSNTISRMLKLESQGISVALTPVHCSTSAPYFSKAVN